uniref:Holliday junction branch migration complex subunit RuvA n=1 Tax=candidate division CPR3 bacterium TaxID=2268181 RepID=A0A7C4M1R7_UNCC3
MIAYLHGSVLLKKENWIIIENQGVGYKVFVSVNIINDVRIGDSTSLYIYHHITESSQSLYGFNIYDEQEFFELLLSISGIGPKVALNVLNAASLGDIREAVIANNPDILTNISGIGKKTAERIVLELKNKITIGDIRPIGTKSADVGSHTNLDVYEALIQLGYNAVEARTAIKMIDPDIQDADKKLKAALKNLGRG